MMPLVVVDVQDAFIDDMCRFRKSYITRVVHHLRRARYQRRPIVLIEYAGQGPSSDEVRDALANYPRMTKRRKRRDDGSKQVIEALEELGAIQNQVQLCGVNWTACVADTAQGLLRRDFNIEIIRSATRDTWRPKMIPTNEWVKNKFADNNIRLV